MAEHIILSFIGVSTYEKTTYLWHGESCEASYAQVAMTHLLDPDRLLIGMTEEARDVHEEALRKRIDFDRLDIPKGRTEGEWWTLFETITRTIPENANLTIDVTHSFRSVSVVALAVSLYLQAASEVDIRRVIYGAYDEADSSDETPFLDLTPFLTIVEWSVAARQFLRDGNARKLSSLMKEVQNEAWREDADIKPEHSQTAASLLQSLTRDLSLLRTQDVLGSSAGDDGDPLIQALDKVREDVDSVDALQPLGVLLGRVRDRLAPLRASNPFNSEGFAAQVETMRFLVQTGQLQQALTLARELMVSYEAHRLGYDPAPTPRSNDEWTAREVAEEGLNRLAKTDKDQRTREGTRRADLWSKLIDARNDVNHAGMTSHPTPGSKLAKRTEEIVEEVASYVLDSLRE